MSAVKWRTRLLLVACLGLLWQTAAGELSPIKVEIRGAPGDYQLYRDGKPYQVRGAGLDASAPDAIDMLRKLKAHGGNSLRTWNVADEEFLDLAHELGVTVAMCLDVARERHGFDYNDEQAVAEQLATFEQQVKRFRNHPALLAWIIGNELNLFYKNRRVYDAVNDISKMIHRLDPNHPTTTTTAGIDSSLASTIAKRAPDLDFVSVQVYAGVFSLGKTMKSVPWEKPVMVSEWGTVGHWEVAKTDWDAPFELDSTQRARVVWEGYTQGLTAIDDLIGNYFFLWGQKQERTPTWYGVFVDGTRTPAVDVLHRVWTGSAPPDQAPLVRALRLKGMTASEQPRLFTGDTYSAEVEAVDPESGPLRYHWELMEESRATQDGGDAEAVPEDYSHLLTERDHMAVELRAPDTPGPYRLFVYVRDEGGAIAHANIPFLVWKK